MEIIFAKNSGLCDGVKRALNIAKKTQGVDSEEDMADIKDGTVIIRSYGVSPGTYDRLVHKKLKVVDATCPIVKKIQKLVGALAFEVDTLFIVGGKNSSNTNKLYQISKRILPQTYFIEKSGQIKPHMLRGANKIGISGGASTPPEAIQEAVAKIQKSSKQSARRENTVQCQR